MITNYNPSQTVFEIGINILTTECVIEPQKILYVGNELLLVEGKSTEWGQSFGEQTLRFSSKNKLNKEEVFERSTCDLWTDSIEEAQNFKIVIDKILEAKKQLTAVQS